VSQETTSTNSSTPVTPVRVDSDVIRVELGATLEGLADRRVDIDGMRLLMRQIDPVIDAEQTLNVADVVVGLGALFLPRRRPRQRGPSFVVPARRPDRTSQLDRVSRWLARLEQDVQARIARELVTHCRALTRSILELDGELERRTVELGLALLKVPGCGTLTAAKLLAEVGPIDRFNWDAQLARHTPAGAHLPRAQASRRQEPNVKRAAASKRHLASVICSFAACPAAAIDAMAPREFVVSP
jgi:hypothetical protein